MNLIGCDAVPLIELVIVDPLYVPGRTCTVTPAVAELAACWIVSQGWA